MKLTIPSFVNSTNPAVEHLIFAFENARRRAYIMKQKGIDRLTILRQLNREIRIPSRYVSAAYDMIKGLPPHKIVKAIKGRSSNMLRKEFPELCKLPSLWTRSYFCSTAGNVSNETIRKYIEAQSKK